MECKFTLSINKFDCPLNCSGRGRCIHNTNGTHTCLCDEVGTSPGGLVHGDPPAPGDKDIASAAQVMGTADATPSAPACMMRCHHCLYGLLRASSGPCAPWQGSFWILLYMGGSGFSIAA